MDMDRLGPAQEPAEQLPAGLSPVPEAAGPPPAEEELAFEQM